MGCHLLLRGSSWPRDRTQISFIGRWILYHCIHLGSPLLILENTYNNLQNYVYLSQHFFSVYFNIDATFNIVLSSLHLWIFLEDFFITVDTKLNILLNCALFSLILIHHSLLSPSSQLGKMWVECVLLSSWPYFCACCQQKINQIFCFTWAFIYPFCHCQYNMGSILHEVHTYHICSLYIWKKYEHSKFKKESNLSKISKQTNTCLK